MVAACFWVIQRTGKKVGEDMIGNLCDIEFASQMRSDSDRALNEYGHDLLSQYRAAVELAGFDFGTGVLDVATGSGRMAYVLSHLGFENVISGDISREVLDAVLEKMPDESAQKIDFQLFDATCLPFEDDSFGAVVCAQGMHEMDEPEKVVEELARVCALGGKLLIVDFNKDGFELIDKIHRQMGRPPHNQGKAAAADIHQWLFERFETVRSVDFPINNVWVATNKKKACDYIDTSV